jgi:hypothetical protein
MRKVKISIMFSLTNKNYPYNYKQILPITGIFQPFELGGVTRLIRSAVKLWKAGN